MHGSRKFCQRVSNSTLTAIFFFFLVDEGIENPKGVWIPCCRSRATMLVPNAYTRHTCLSGT